MRIKARTRSGRMMVFAGRPKAGNSLCEVPSSRPRGIGRCARRGILPAIMDFMEPGSYQKHPRRCPECQAANETAWWYMGPRVCRDCGVLLVLEHSRPYKLLYLGMMAPMFALVVVTALYLQAWWILPVVAVYALLSWVVPPQPAVKSRDPHCVDCLGQLRDVDPAQAYCRRCGHPIPGHWKGRFDLPPSDRKRG